MAEFETYSLPLGDTILHRPDTTFPPGHGTIKMADLAADDLNDLWLVSEGRDQPFNVLELGVGPGTFLVELASHLIKPDRFNLAGIDFDPLSVKLARHNLRNVARRRCLQINSEIYEANWSVSETWKGFKRNSFHLIYFNPPYLDPESEVPKKLMETPRDMVFGEGLGALYHYRRVLPELPAVLSHQPGSAILFRMPEYLNLKDLSSDEAGSLGSVLWTKIFTQIPTARFTYYDFEPNIKGHFCKITVQ